ncbi:MAG: MFS transporter [Candidatus Helarchaeota archaeon]
MAIKIKSSSFLLIGLSISVSMVSLTDSMVNVVLPYILSDLKIAFTMASWINIAPLLLITCLIVIFGRLGDLTGRKRFIILGITIYMVGAILCSTSISGMFLIGYRGIQGVGSALLISNIYAIPKDIFPPHKHGQAISIITLGIYIGLTIAPFLGGFLIDYLNWRWIFLICLPIEIIGLIIIQFTYKSKVKRFNKEKFDYIGAILLALMLLTLYLALTLGNQIGWDVPIIIMFVIFGGTLIGFILSERKIETPMIPLNLFKKLNFTTSTFAALLFYISTMSVGFLLPIYFKVCFGYYGLIIGLVLFPMPLFMSIFTPISGFLSDKFVNRKISISGLIILFIFFIFMSFLDFNPPYSFVFLSIGGIGQGLFTAANVGMIMDSVDPRKRGIASSISTMMRTIGQSSSYAISTAILGVFLPFNILNAILSGNISLSPDQIELFTSSLHTTFLFMSFFSLSSLILILIQFFNKNKK